MVKIRRFFKTWREILSIYYSIHGKLVVFLFALNIFRDLFAIVGTYAFSLFIEKLSNFEASTPHTEYLAPVLILVIYQTLNSFSDLIYYFFENRLNMWDVALMRVRLSSHLASIGIGKLENPELTNKTTRFSETMGQFYGYLSGALSAISLIISLIISFAIFFRLMPVFSILLVGVLLIKFFVNQKYMGLIWEHSIRNTEESRRANQVFFALTNPGYMKEISITGGQDFIKKIFVGFNNKYMSGYFSIRDKWFVSDLIFTVINSLFYAWGLVMLILKTSSGVIGLATATFYVRSIFTFVEQLDILTVRLSRLLEQSARIEDSLSVFSEFSAAKEGEFQLSASKNPPKIEIDNLFFKYQNSNNFVLNDINLTVNPGEKVAIVGENGAGKTTLVKLLCKVYEPTGGKIRVDGFNLNEVKTLSWNNKLGTLFQDFNTYGALTVRDNVAIGGEKIDDDLVWDALKKSGASGFVKKFPKKLDQVLSEVFKGGIRPSGGQWQKIAIARMFYRNAPILIMDEPTAAIDAISEAKIFNNIYKFMKGKSVIIISHRFSTVRNADRIIVLDKGRIIEQGTHDELIELRGKYFESFSLQAKGYS